MAALDAPVAAVLEALGYALFRAETDGTLRLSGAAPEWLAQLWPAAANAEADLPVAELSPFLENFLIDAAECWRGDGEARARSGAWVELDGAGNKFELEATALTAAGQSLLLLERLGEVYATKKSMLQVARENVIAQQRLNSEIEKKEILLHCVAEEMSGALANVITSLRLVQGEETSPRGATLIELASRGAEEQRTLIHKVLAVFSDDLDGIFAQESRGGSELGVAMEQAKAALQPSFDEKRVQLLRTGANLESVQVPIEANQLARLISNLLEDALEQASSGSEVRVAAAAEADSVLCEIVADGASTHTEPNSRAALRVQFNRMIVEGCGGELGHAPDESGGERSWMRLPRAHS